MNFELLEKLVNTPTPTGEETAGALMLGRYIKAETGIDATIDMHGNLHAVYDVGAKRTVMLEGHGDEIGYMVEYIDEQGFVYFQALGGITVPLSAAERIDILGRGGIVHGVMGARPPHLSKKDGDKVPSELKSLPCDIGASSRAEAEALVSVGDSAVVAASYRPLAGTRVSGRGFDNRAGTFAMCEAFIKIVKSAVKPSVNVHYVSTVCEEIGLVGGRLASYSVHPDIGISCDVAFAGDTPGDDEKVVGDIRLGGGASVAVGPIYHKRLVSFALFVAERDGIAVQKRAVPKGAGNNGWSLKLERGGAAVLQIAIPLRYMHSPVEVIDLKDVAAVTDLVASIVQTLPADFPLLPEQP